jgi:hypothetical protein
MAAAVRATTITSAERTASAPRWCASAGAPAPATATATATRAVAALEQRHEAAAVASDASPCSLPWEPIAWLASFARCAACYAAPARAPSSCSPWWGCTAVECIVDPELETARFQPLNLKCDFLVSKFAFLTILLFQMQRVHRYSAGALPAPAAASLRHAVDAAMDLVPLPSAPSAMEQLLPDPLLCVGLVGLVKLNSVDP